MSAKKIAAVVVTFNRLALLERCLAALLAQGPTKPELLIVVDNASTDGTDTWLRNWANASSDEPIHPGSSATAGLKRHVHRMPQNLGGSGGFRFGIDEALRQGADWIWVMDDDSIAKSDCLHQLISAGDAHPRAGFISSIVRWKDGSLCLSNATQADPTSWSEPLVLDGSAPPVVQITTGTFVGMLLRAEAVRSVGLPVAEFFIWYDDIEYSQRLSRQWKGLAALRAEVVHMIPDNQPPNFSRVDQRSVWKYKYGIRNETAVTIRSRRFGLARVALLWLQRWKEMAAGGVPVGLRLQLIWAGVKGLFFNYRKLI